MGMVTIPPIKMVMTGGWFMTLFYHVLPTLFGMIMTKWLVHVIVYYWVSHIKWDVDQQWMLVILGECSGIYDLYNKPSW